MQNENDFENILKEMNTHGYIGKFEETSLKIKYRKYLKYKEHLDSKVSLHENIIVQSNTPEYKHQSFKDTDVNINDNVKVENTASVPAKQIINVQMTKEQIRERNLSWILNIGVILLLVSGVIFATTTWSSFSNVVKVILLFCVSLFFFGVSIFSKNVLKINKTSDAFWIMGSLFLPVSLLSIGFFKLLGDYYSLFGHGRYLFGVFCILVCLPIYIFSTYKYKSRIYSWLTLSISSLLFAFIIASLYLPHLLLVLILFIFNALLLLFKYKANLSQIINLFFKDLGIFIQLNLLITIAFTMTSFSFDMLYSINVLILSLIVFALSITEKNQLYDYFSAVIFSIGICLLSQSINNINITLLLITSIGFVFSSVAFIYKNDTFKHKNYVLMSSIATAISFLYLALTIPFIHSNDSAIYMGIAYLILLIMNYALLFSKANLKIASAFIPIQIFVVIYEMLSVLNLWTNLSIRVDYLTAMTAIFFVIGYCVNKSARLKIFSFSVAITSFLSTIFVFILCIIQKGIFVSLPIIAAVFSFQIFIIWIKTQNKYIKLTTAYLLPFTIWSALSLMRYSYGINDFSAIWFYFICALIVFCLQFAAAGKLKSLKDSFFYIGHILAGFICLLLLLSSQTLQIQTLSLTLMCVVYSYSIYRHKNSNLSYLWLNALLLTFSVLLFYLANILFTYMHIDLFRFVLFINGFLLLLSFIFIKSINIKRNIVIYMCFLAAGIILEFYFLAGEFLWYMYPISLAYSALICVAISKVKYNGILFLPMLLYIISTYFFINITLESNIYSIVVVIAGIVVLMTAGRLSSKLLFSSENIDFYSITALAAIFILPYHYEEVKIQSLSVLIPSVLGSIWFFYNSKRITQNDCRPGNTLFAASLLWPFYCFVSTLNIPSIYFTEVVFLPLIVLSFTCIKWIYRGVRLNLFEYIIPAFCYSIIILSLLSSDNVLQALIIGGFALFSLIYGSIFKTKSALLFGGIVVVLVVIIKSKDFWLSLQWWIYLAVIGGILVITASINEYQKNKNIQSLLPRVNTFLEKFRDWE